MQELTREEIAEAEGVHVRTVDRWIRKGLLEATKGVSGDVLISGRAYEVFRTWRRTRKPVVPMGSR